MVKKSLPRSIGCGVVLALLVVLAGPASVGSAGDQEYSAVMAWGKLQVYERGSNGKLMHRSFNPEKKAWSKWEPVTAKEISSAPWALMTDGGTRLAVFFRGTDGKLYHVYRDKEGAWSEVIGIGDREMRSGPTAVLVGEELTVFARGTSGKLMKIYYDKGKGDWSDWSDVD
jgi:hypothetical protein